MKILPKILFLILSSLFFLYLAIPSPAFPAPVPDALQSQELGDTETPLRRAYFTNYSRDEVMGHYQNEFAGTKFGFDLPVLRLNYPPEEAQEKIRDQTRSTFLEELVRPFREGVYINGFEPQSAKDAIIQDGRSYRQKITVKYHDSSLVARLGVAVLTAGALYLILTEWGLAAKALTKNA